MIKKIISGLLLVGMIVFCIVAEADVLCTHEPIEMGRAYQYQQRPAGHVKITKITLYCEECDKFGYETFSNFEGHNFHYAGNLHQGNNWHVSYYECNYCDYQTTEGYFCEGPPCRIMMSLTRNHEIR